MVKKIWKLLLPVLILCIAVSGCTIEEESRQEEDSKYRFYYLNSSETGLESEPYTPKEETADFMLPDLMSRLNAKEDSLSGISLLPEEVEITSYQIADTVLSVEFNSRYKKISAAREVLTRAGVVKTLLQIPGIEDVKFYIGQEELKNSKKEPVGEMNDVEFNSRYKKISAAREVLTRAGVVKTLLQIPGIEDVKFYIGQEELKNSKKEPVGEMNDNTFAEVSSKDIGTYRSDTFTLYFTDIEGKHLVEEKRKVYYRHNIPKVRVALEQLAKGPMKENHFQTIPEDTRLLNVTVADGACYVDVNPVFVDYALTNVEESIPIYSVVNTVLAACDAEKVEMSVSGQREVVFREHMTLYNFYKWTEDIISGKDKEK